MRFVIALLCLIPLWACEGTVAQTGPIHINTQNPGVVFHEIPFVVTRHDCAMYLTHVLIKFTFTVNGKEDWQMTSVMIEPERENPYMVWVTVEAREGERVEGVKVKGYTVGRN